MSKNIILKSTLLNIDSSFRNLYPKNIYASNGKILPSNPLTLTQNSNIVSINYPSHSLSNGDNIIIQNVEGISNRLINSFHLVNNFKYVIIIYNDNTNMINSNYKSFTNSLYINIEIIGNQTESNSLNNIAFNSLTGIKQSLLANDISSDYLSTITNFAIEQFGSFNINILNSKCLFFELPYEYYNNNANSIIVNQVFKISYLHIGGINLGYFNSNYPINNYNYQSSYSVYNVIDENSFEIQLNFYPFANIIGGGSNIQIMKILNSITGYPDANSYVINLKKSFNNVVSIELTSSEFPYVDIVITKNVNDKLYWKHIDDGSQIYSVTIDEGFYSPSTIITKLINNINRVPRIGYSVTNPIYNNFDIILESNIQKITFKPYKLTAIPNGLSCFKELINGTVYYVLNVNQPFNIVEPGDTITISGSTNITLQVTIDTIIQTISIDPIYINKEQTVYLVNLKKQTYSIILGSVNQISTTVTTLKSEGGGENVVIKSKTKASFLFNYPDTFGDVLGFKNVGNNYSILDFSSSITNQDSYINSNNLDSVGNIISYSSGFVNFVGVNNYFLMYLNDIEYIYSNNNLPASFAKIQLSGNPGDILFNTFVTTPANIYSQNFPIPTLTDITVKFIYSDGSLVNFRNINHSFTLKITESLIQNDDTYMNSKHISVADEFKKAKLTD